MPALTGRDKWYNLTKILRDAVAAGLSTQPDRVSIVPGVIAWDACDCGALYLATGQTYLSEVFPNQMTTVLSDYCYPPYEVSEIIIQIMRCAPVPKPPAVAPTVKSLDDSSQLVRRDAFEVMTTLASTLCPLAQDGTIEGFIIDLQMPAGPGGTCVGTETRCRVGLRRG